MRRFEDKVALVTGAASGIGRASAERLASEGARVFCVDVQAGAVEQTAKRVCRIFFAERWPNGRRQRS